MKTELQQRITTILGLFCVWGCVSSLLGNDLAEEAINMPKASNPSNSPSCT